MEFKYLEENKILNLVTGKKFILNATGKKFFEEILTNDFASAVKRLSEFYDVDETLIETDLKTFNETINADDNYEYGSLPFKNYIVLEPTNDCSANCIHCFHKNSQKYSWNKTEIDYYIHLLKVNKITCVSLTGGEIFSPHYVENAKYLINRLNDNSIEISTISTNGMFLTKDLADWIHKNLNINNTIFRISLDMVNESKVLQFRPGYNGYYNKDFWDLLNEKKINVVITTVLTNQTSKDIVDIAKFLQSQPCVKNWLVKPLVPTKKGQFKFLKWNNFKGIYISILDLFKDTPDAFQFSFTLGNVISKNMLINNQPLERFSLVEHPCKNEMFQKTIKSNGYLTRCPMIPEINKDYQTNNLILNDSVNEIFDNLVINDMECKKCKYHVICGGGCRAYALAFNNDKNKCDVNSKFMYDWILKDNYFETNWKEFYKKVKDVIEK